MNYKKNNIRRLSGYGMEIRKAIDEKGWTIKKTAELAGISRETLNGYIINDRAMRYDLAVKLAEVMDCEVSRFTNKTE